MYWFVNPLDGNTFHNANISEIVRVGGACAALSGEEILVEWSGNTEAHFLFSIYPDKSIQGGFVSNSN